MTAKEGDARPRRTWIMKGVLELGLLGIALLMIGDAGTFALMPPSPERARGCYTAVELIVGVSAPSLIRPLELVLGMGLVARALYKTLRRVWNAINRGRAATLPGAG